MKKGSILKVVIPLLLLLIIGVFVYNSGIINSSGIRNGIYYSVEEGRGGYDRIGIRGSEFYSSRWDIHTQFELRRDGTIIALDGNYAGEVVGAFRNGVIISQDREYRRGSGWLW